MADEPTYISTRAFKLLKKLSESEEDELVWCKGGGWWIDLSKVNGRVVKELLTMVLISDQGFGSDTYLVYELNEEGRAMLEDPTYEPKIVDAFRNL